MIRAYCFVALLFGAMFLTQAIVPSLRRRFYAEPRHVAYAVVSFLIWPLFVGTLVHVWLGQLRRAQR